MGVDQSEGISCLCPYLSGVWIWKEHVCGKGKGTNFRENKCFVAEKISEFVGQKKLRLGRSVDRFSR